MTNQNLFSDKFKNKTSDELRKIIFSDDYQQEAKDAALAELENRNEWTEADKKRKSLLEAKGERTLAGRLSGRRYDTFGPRFFAAIIDGFVLWPVSLIFVFITNTDIITVAILASLVKDLMPYIYSVIMHGEYGQTLGKMAMGVKVVDFETEESIGYKEAFIRDSVPIALMIGLYGYTAILLSDIHEGPLEMDITSLAPMFFIGILTILWTLLEIFSMLLNSKSRAVHDFIAGTVVVRTN